MAQQYDLVDGAVKHVEEVELRAIRQDAELSSCVSEEWERETVNDISDGDPSLHRPTSPISAISGVTSTSITDSNSNTCCKALRVNWRRRAEMLAVIVAAVIVCGLISVPSFFYLLEPTPSRASTDNEDIDCFPVSSPICNDALLQLQNCLPEKQDRKEVLFSSVIDPEETENTAAMLLSGLTILNPSDECLRRAKLFLCLYLFPLCDSANTTHRPTYNECIELKAAVCEREWKDALEFIQLPECEDFEDTPPLCSKDGNLSLPVDESVNSSKSSINCSDHFFIQNGSCKPICESWPGSTESLIQDIVVGTSVSIGMVSGFLVLVISCLRWKNMCVFPPVLVIYITVTLLMYCFFLLLSFGGRASLFCSSDNLIESLETSTVFCSISGSAFCYVLLQLSLWWFCHIAILFWKVMFPFHSKLQQDSGHIKYIHVATVAIALLVPFIPVAVGLATQGFVISSFPPLYCVTRNSDVAFYTLVVPVSFLFAIGIIMLLAVLWAIRRHQMYSRKKSFLGPAGKKVIIVFLYYTAVAFLALLSFTLDVRNTELYTVEVLNYFACESRGNGSCPTSGFQQLSNPVITYFAICLWGFFPAINLIYALNFKELKSRFLRKKHVQQSKL